MTTAINAGSETASSGFPPSICPLKTYDCELVFEKEDDGGYSVSVLNLPGAASEGDTLDEATDNIREAIRGLLDEYSASNMPIPWREIPADAMTNGAMHRRIFVDG